MQDDGGDVLGNLPRSRPGRRSEKRTTGAAKRSTKAKPKTANRPAASAKKAATKSKTGARKPAAKKPAAAKKTTAARKPAGARRPSAAKQPTAPPSRGGNPVEEAVRAATKVAETGLKVAGDVTREVLRRIPRP